MRKIVFIVSTIFIAGVAAAAEPELNVRQIMLGLTVPASDVVFNVQEPPGDPDLYWETVEANAVMLAESGALLMREGVARDEEDWMRYAQALIDTSMATAEAAHARDVDAVFETGFAVYDVCDVCHRKYLVIPDQE